jgi:Protein of unknown function (DUF2510)
MAAGYLLWVGWLIADGSHLLAAGAIGTVAAVAVRRHRRARATRWAGLQARADLEHRLTLAGDPRGTFGRYPPLRAGWFTDPTGGPRVRYFDGVGWTTHVAAPRHSG